MHPITFLWDTHKAAPTACGFGPSPFGTALVVTDTVGLCGLGFGTDEAAMAAELGCTGLPRDDAAAKVVLSAIFAAEGPLVVHLCGTAWQIAVWQGLRAIPPGTTETYGELAARLDRPNAARAVGAAVGANPVAWLVPCHRVVGKGGALTGFRWGLSVKRAMLAAEA